MNTQPSSNDIILWGFVTSCIWSIGGGICAVMLYKNINQEIAMSPTPQNLYFLIKLITPWVTIGLIYGIFNLFQFISLANVFGPVQAYPMHLCQCAVISMTLGAIIGYFLYPIVTPPTGVILRALFWRITLPAFVALIATNVALRIIGNIGKSIR